jgi:2-polyprenyl-3-methyl-5-hydroxy-6-metoxy-1,4-benzoquinol methylase
MKLDCQYKDINKGKSFYNYFHSNTSSQNKLISLNNFTYGVHIKLVKSNIQFNHIKVLDYGCGAGSISLLLASWGHEVTGVDISDKAIFKAKQSAFNLHLSQGCKFYSVNQFYKKCISHKYDMIILFEVLEHIKEDSNLIKLLNKKLNDNGSLILSIPLSSAPLNKIGLLNNFDNTVGHLRRYSVDEIVSLLKNNKFQIEKIVKSEGVLRNILFTQTGFGWLVKILKYPISSVFTAIDNLFGKLFGYSNVIIVCRK